MLRVRDVMTRPVVSVTPVTPLKEVARLLVEHGISGVPVVTSDGAVVGVVSETDFLIKERGASAVRRRPFAAVFGESSSAREQLAKVAASTAGEAMSSPAVTIDLDRSVREAASAMVGARVNRLPVVENGRLVGIVTRADLMRSYVRSDGELAETIRDEVLRRSLWLDPDEFEVEVVDGIVSIRGRVGRRSTAEILERITGFVPGVVAVRADISWELDDRGTVAPGRDYVSAITAPRDR